MNGYRHILITGGSGFIGSHFVRMALDRWPQTRITNLDLLTYAGNPKNLEDCESHPNYRFVHGDIRNAQTVLSVLEEGCDAVVHFAAESHVDRSILSSDDFITTNFMGTHVLLEASRKTGVEKFVFIGTDEVYGSLSDPDVADEKWPMDPNSPYSVSKAAADMLVHSYVITHQFPGVITRASNNFGPYQYPEKLISLFVTNLLEKKKVPLYGDGLNVRNWIYVTDHCEGIARVLEAGRVGEVYNIGGHNSMTNTQIAEKILAALGVDSSWIQHVQDRPGHDRRYAIDSSKIERELNWQPRWSFEDGLAETVQWYKNHRSWWEPIKSGAYREYYETQYGTRQLAAMT